MKKKLSLLVCLLLSFSFLCLTYPVSARAAEATCLLDGVEYAVLTPSEDGTVTLPDAPTGLSMAFAGWSVRESGGEKLYPPSAEVTFVSGAEYKGVLIDFVTGEGAELRYVDSDVGVRFVTRLDKVDYNRLCTLVGGDNISFGTYITARELMFYTDFVFTPEALAEAGYADWYLDVETDGFFTEEARAFTIAGSVASILDENRSRSYVGVGYMQIRYADGTVGTVYSPFDYNVNCSSPFDVVFDAYEDRHYSYPYTIPAGGDHGGANNTSSRYTVAEHNELKAFLDSVAAVDLSLNAQREYVYIPTTGKYYRSPWLVSYEYANEKDEVFTVTVTAPEGMSINNVKSFLLVGSRISLTAEGITVTDVSITAKHSNYTPEY